jgi:hypothetical protein
MGHRADIVLTGGTGGTVRIDGEQFGGVTGINLSHDVRAGLPRLTVDFILSEGADVAVGVADVSVPQKTRDALIALGWAPPDGA